MTTLLLTLSLALASSHEEPAEPDAAEATEAEELPPGPVVDRSGPPPVVAPEVLALDELTVHELTDAATAYHVRIPGVRKVKIAVVPRRGRASLTDTVGLESTAVGWLADTASQSIDASTFSELEDLHSVDVYSRIGYHMGAVGVEAPLHELDKALEMLTEIVRGASFPKTETKRWVLDQYQYLGVTGPSSQRGVAHAALAFAWFPADTPYGARLDPDVLADIEPARLERLYRKWLAESPLQVMVVGDVAYEDVELRLKAIVDGLGTPGDPDPEVPFEVQAGQRVIAVDMPGQEQVAVRFRTQAPSYRHEDRVPLIAANYVLGGHFLSRLNANLREDKGWTYGSRSSYRVGEEWGTEDVSVAVQAENAAAVVREIEGELQRLVDDGVTEQELQLAYRRLVADWNGTRATADEAYSTYDVQLTYGISAEEARAVYQQIGELSPEQVQGAAARWLGPDEPRLWVLVGDRTKLEPHLEELGWSAEWLTPQQAILGSF